MFWTSFYCFAGDADDIRVMIHEFKCRMDVFDYKLTAMENSNRKYDVFD